MAAGSKKRKALRDRQRVAVAAELLGDLCGLLGAATTDEALPALQASPLS
jgi:hypothetical protein